MRRWATVLALAVLAGCGVARSAGEAVRSVGGAITASGAEQGGMCGVPGLVATRRDPVEGPGNCGVADPIVVTRVAGVDLSRPAILTCDAARGLDRWLRDGAIPAAGSRGGGLAEIQVAAHYACRTRNSQRGARLSEHARGRAIDVSSFVFRDGSRVGVLSDWNGRPADRRLLREMHRTACGPFGTVLGPDSDRFHRDHFHFDVADYRSGPYCR